MSKVKDLTGMKFGRLTVVERRGSDKQRRALWLCKCECGKEVIVCGCNLTRGNTKSCGCYNSEKVNDLTGIKFGRLTVVERYENNKYGHVLWLCKCECGNKIVVRSYSLINGHTKSCGCYRKDKMKEQWQDEEFRQMKSDEMKEMVKEKWQDEEFRQTQSNKMKEQWQDKEFRQIQNGKIKEIWEDEDMKWRMHYKGGISPISTYLRNLPIVSQWRKDTYVRENSRCQLTGKHVHGGNSDVHHLYGFNMIVLEAHELYNIEIHEIVAEYTQEELYKLEEYIKNWHKDTSNAVLLSEDVHSLFHNLYGYGNNTKEQYIEFKQRYLMGEFEEVLNKD